MKTVFLLSALACAVLAAPGHHSNHHFGDSSEQFEIREKKSPTFKHPIALVQPVPLHVTPIHAPLHQPLLHHGLGYKKPHLGLLREADGKAEDVLVQSKETENQRNVEESIQMTKAAFDNLENDLNNIEDHEKSASIEKARQALEDARKSFAELQSMRIISPIVDEAVSVPTTDLRKTETERMAQWKDHKETVQGNEEGSTAPKHLKAIEMEESASNNKESFRALDGHDNLPNLHFNNNSEEGQINKSVKEVTSSMEQPKNAEEVEKVKPQTKNLEAEDMKAKNTFNRNSVSSTHDLPEIKNVQKNNMQKNVNMNEHPRASNQFLEVPKQPQHTDVKPQNSAESRPMMPVDSNKNNKNRESFIKSAEHIDSKGSSTQNKEHFVEGKSAESEQTLGHHENQFMAVRERANQVDLPWRPPGSKIDMRNQEGEMRENVQWKHLPQTDMRSAYGASYGIGGIGGAGGAGIINGGAGSGSGGAGAIGIFPNAQVSNCAIPLLLSCSPSVVPGSLGKTYSSSYGSSSGAYGSSASAGVLGAQGAYRSGGEGNHPAKRDAKNQNRIELSKTKRTAPKDQQYRMGSKKY